MLHVGIIGCGKIAQVRHLPEYAHNPGVRIVSLFDLNAERAQALAVQYGATAAPGWQAILQNPEVDAVSVCTSNDTHADIACAALAAGKHVLCEKPMAMQAGDFDALIAARDAAGVLAAEGFMIVHHPQWQRARQLLADGAIGRLWRIDGAFSFNNRDTGNIRNQADMGGGGLRDIGVYVMGGVRYATGLEPTQVQARIQWENGVDVFAALTARFALIRAPSIALPIAAHASAAAMIVAAQVAASAHVAAISADRKGRPASGVSGSATHARASLSLR